MTRTDLRTYTPEFRAEAVKVVLEQGLSPEAAAQRLPVPKGTLTNWTEAAKQGSTASASATGRRSVVELEKENARLRRKLAVERIEKEVLKKPRRTLLGSRCPVRAIEDDATRLSYCAVVSCFCGVAQRFLRLAQPEAIVAPASRRAFKGGNQGGRPTESRTLWRTPHAAGAGSIRLCCRARSEWASKAGNELTHHQHHVTRAHAKAAIQEYIEIFYNRQRRHPRIGYQSPALFAESFKYVQAA